MWAIVPLKNLDQAKQRLSALLTPAQRRQLMLAMARDVLTALSQARRLRGILIVSRTQEADALAAAFATERYRESPEADLSDALTAAAAHLASEYAARGVMIVPADVPLITPAEVDAAIEGHQGVTVIPDAERIGTNGLLVSPPDAIPLLFDGKSFQPHLQAAYASGLTPQVRPLPGFGLDIDTGEDLLDLIRRDPGTQTGTYLDKSGLADRLTGQDNDQSGPAEDRGRPRN